MKDTVETILTEGKALHDVVDTNNANFQEDIESLQIENEKLRSDIEQIIQENKSRKDWHGVLRTQIDKVKSDLDKLDKSTRMSLMRRKKQQLEDMKEKAG